MNVTIIGAGAIGGHIAAKLAAAGESVKVVARGEHLKAIRERGLTLKENGEEIVARVQATDRIADAGGADLVVLGVKAHQLTPIAAEVASIVTPSTILMMTQNGFPWWYFFKHGGPHEGVQLESVDPGGVIARHLPIDAIVAAISYQAAEIESPGVIRHIEGHRVPVAEIDGQKTERIAALVRALHKSRLQIARAHRRALRNLDEALGQSDLQSDKRAHPRDAGRICRFAPTRTLAAAMMQRSASRRRSVRHPFSSQHRKADRWRRERRRAQDFDAAGHRAWPRDRGRCAAWLSHRARSPRQCPDPAS